VVDRRLRGQTLEVGGPQNLTLNELAAFVHEVRGDRGKIRHVPRRVLRAMAPVARRVRAAVTMDTMNMTFDAMAARAGFADLPMTDLRAALARTAGEPQGCP
jgi:hypothetical protein